MRIAVTGLHGQVVTALVERGAAVLNPASGTAAA